MAEAVRKRIGSTFYFYNDMFDAVPFSIGLVSEIELVASAGELERIAAINEVGGGFHVVFTTQFAEEQPRETIIRDGPQLRVKEFVSG